MLNQHRLVEQRRPASGNEHQPAIAPREMLFQHFHYVRLNVDCRSRVMVFGTLCHPTHMLRCTCTTRRNSKGHSSNHGKAHHDDRGKAKVATGDDPSRWYAPSE
jgi:hypothetical protein